MPGFPSRFRRRASTGVPIITGYRSTASLCPAWLFLQPRWISWGICSLLSAGLGPGLPRFSGRLTIQQPGFQGLGCGWTEIRSFSLPVRDHCRWCLPRVSWFRTSWLHFEKDQEGVRHARHRLCGDAGGGVGCWASPLDGRRVMSANDARVLKPGTIYRQWALRLW